MPGNKGYSLLEVLMGFLIFLIGFVGVSTILISTVKSTKFSSDLTEAVFLATNRLEALQGLPYQNASLNDTDGDGVNGLSDAGCGPADACAAKADSMQSNQGRNGMYTIYWNVAVDQPLSNSKTVNVIAVWSVKGVSQQINIRGIRTM
ncbi:MAG: hypothetical protein A2521_10600 [Deltaproteobacteria bacterium RIFOXYD12_FULL_57_12]|nr:MAG: hypothetical protein A2521_10600 [Deltaproteobacteria bacterium RIFOXYD12_FULL_57_12]